MADNLGIKTGIKTKVRIKVLFDVINELSESFNFPDITSILYKGIVKRQILESIYAYYINEEKKSVGCVWFNIDWKLHKMYASTSTGNELEVASDRPLVEQFALWSSDIVEYVNQMQKELKVNKVKVHFRYIEEISNSKDKVEEANEFLGLVNSKDDIETDKSAILLFDRKMSFVSEMLPELEIKIQSCKE